MIRLQADRLAIYNGKSVVLASLEGRSWTERGNEFEEATGRMKSVWVKVIEVQDMIEIERCALFNTSDDCYGYVTSLLDEWNVSIREWQQAMAGGHSSTWQESYPIVILSTINPTQTGPHDNDDTVQSDKCDVFYPFSRLGIIRQLSFMIQREAILQ